MKNNKIQLILFGCGSVGSGALRYFIERDDPKLDQYEIPFIVVKDTSKVRPEIKNLQSYSARNPPKRPQFVGKDKLVDLLQDPTVDIIIDAVGGDDCSAMSYIEAAMNSGKHVVTANKNNISGNLSRLIKLANEKRVNLRYEGSVCGGIPIIRILREYFGNDRINKIAGIINGTSNYILTQMHRGISYEDALREAQEKGYAETNSENDVDGTDAAAKLAILTSLAFKTQINPGQINIREGISQIDRDDMYAVTRMISEDRGMPHVIKHLAIAERKGCDLELRIHPAFISARHPLYGTDGATNAVTIVGEYSGEHTFKGPGAGSNPTGFALFSDVFEIGENIRRGVFENFSEFDFDLEVSQTIQTGGYIISTSPEHQVGVFHIKTGVAAGNNIDIWQIRNFPLTMARGKDNLLPDIMCIEKTYEERIRNCIDQLKKAKYVVGEPKYVREDVIELASDKTK